MKVHGYVPPVRGIGKHTPIAHLAHGTLRGEPIAGLAELMTEAEWQAWLGVDPARIARALRVLGEP